MAVESPANISILGINPLSIEAGLYARFMGYHVVILGNHFCNELLETASNPVDPATNISSLGIRALQAQEESLDAGFLTSVVSDNQSLLDQYVQKLSQSDLLIDALQTNCQKFTVKMIEEALPQTVDENIEYDTRVFELLPTPTNMSGNTDVLIDMRTNREQEQLVVDYPFEIERANGSALTIQMQDWLTRGQPEGATQRLYTSIDDFYLIGEGSLPPEIPFDFKMGLNQVRDLFKILCDRSELNLYAD